MLYYFFMVMLIVTAIFLIVLVLIQRGKGGGLAGAFGGMGGQSAFGTKAGDLFTKITVGVAFFWIILCLASLKYYTSIAGGRLTSMGGAQNQSAPGGVPGSTPNAAPASGGQRSIPAEKPAEKAAPTAEPSSGNSPQSPASPAKK